MRIVLLIANGGWLPLYAVGAASHVYVLATHDYAVAEAITTHVVCFFILASSPTSGALGRSHIMKKEAARRIRASSSWVVLLSYNHQAMHKPCASRW